MQRAKKQTKPPTSWDLTKSFYLTTMQLYHVKVPKNKDGGPALGLRQPQKAKSVVQVQEGMSMCFKCASRARVAFAVFPLFSTCCVIASKRAAGIVLHVIHVVRVLVFCLHPCFWMHVLRCPPSVCSFQLQKNRFWALVEDKPQSSSENEDKGED